MLSSLRASQREKEKRDCMSRQGSNCTRKRRYSLFEVEKATNIFPLAAGSPFLSANLIAAMASPFHKELFVLITAEVRRGAHGP